MVGNIKLRAPGGGGEGEGEEEEEKRRRKRRGGGGAYYERVRTWETPHQDYLKYYGYFRNLDHESFISFDSRQRAWTKYCTFIPFLMHSR